MCCVRIFANVFKEISIVRAKRKRFKLIRNIITLKKNNHGVAAYIIYKGSQRYHSALNAHQSTSQPLLLAITSLLGKNRHALQKNALLYPRPQRAADKNPRC